MMAIFNIVYVTLFFLALFSSLKFEWGKEGSDERGKSIASNSYRIIIPALPLGWLALELYSDYIRELSYDTYKIAIWYILTGLTILHAITIGVLKRRY